jgi:hypothetical protein
MRGAAVGVVLCLLTLSAAGCSSTRRSGSSPSTSAAVASTTTTAPTTTVEPVSTSTPSGGSTSSLGAYLPLYPFSTLGEVQRWQASYLSGGNQPWHLDAGQTALSFASWLGFGDVNAVTKTTTDKTGAHESVGFKPTSSSSVTSAIVHLVRWGSGPDIPWEVVGTDDTNFSLTAPAYGTRVSSSFSAGGLITGVDENIKVQVKDLQGSSAVGSYCCLPAGGTNTRWTVPLSITALSGHVVTIAAQTGGHVAAVERFTVTGVVAH